MACDSTSGAYRALLKTGQSAFRGLAFWCLAIACTPPAWASDPAALCDAAAQRASAATGVPLSVLRAISLTETGRKRGGKMRPWPWTVNMEGKGVWFDDADSAMAYAYKHYKRGARSFDVGCFQLNYKWHGQNFTSIEEMFKPDPNAQYAANFLHDLYQEKGDWSAAAGAYHSRTKTYADRYRKRFDRYRATFTDQGGPPLPLLAAGSGQPDAPTQSAPVEVALRVNTYPLLQSGQGERGLGSLVPLGTTARPGLFTRAASGVGG
ncbi:transglycosylase SLT domain-containing protein [Actibacterium sp. D379-3]